MQHGYPAALDPKPLNQIQAMTDKLNPSLPQPPCTEANIEDFLSAPTPEVVATVKNLQGPILLLGAGGKMGLHLSLMLHKAAKEAGRDDLRVIAVSRFTSHRATDEFHNAGLETIACDLSDEAAVAALPDAPTVFFLAGVKFGTSSSPALLEQMNVTMPRLVAKRFSKAVIVAFSTGCVYPFVPTDSSGATEQTKPEPVGDYAVSCYKRESAFAEASEKYGTKVVLIRLNYSVEFRYGVLVDIATKVLEGKPVNIEMGHLNAIWQRDATAQIIRAVTVAQSPAVPLNITGEQVYRVRDIAEDFGKLFNKSVSFEGQEAPTAWLNDASHSHSLFGKPATDLKTMEQWIASWLARGGSTWGKPTGFENRDGKF